jgi:hypothetical protein
LRPLLKGRGKLPDIRVFAQRVGGAVHHRTRVLPWNGASVALCRNRRPVKHAGGNRAA